MHYVTSAAALTDVLKSRASQREEIRTSVESFVREKYGIDDLYRILDGFFGSPSEQGPLAVLARQVASVSTEDISFVVGASALGLRHETIPFGRDAFTARNHDKLRRVRIPWISWSKKGNMVLAHQSITPATNEELEGMPLDRIRTEDGTDMVAYHSRLREIATGRPVRLDVSPLHVELLRAARRKPSFVFRETEQRERRHVMSTESAIFDRDRPPAAWYYVLYLSWFVDGTRVLFETYDNPLSEVAHAKRLFEDAADCIRSGTGFGPIVVKIPHLSNDMLYCNRHILNDGPGAIEALSRAASSFDTSDTVAFFRKIADEVIAYR